MKEGWERMDPPASLDLREINEIVTAAFPAKKVTSAERIGVGLSNANYKVHVEGLTAPYVLRLYRQGRDIADKELAVARLVRQTVPVADFIYADTSCSAFEQPWALLEWKEGVLLRDLLRKGSPRELASAAASVGSVLAGIHRFTFPDSGFFDKTLRVTEQYPMNGERFLAFIEDYLFRRRCGRWLGEELVEEAWSFCQRYGFCLSESGEKPVLVHSDFNGLNILMDETREGCPVSAVLDWEYAFAWSRNADIANILRYEEDGSVFVEHFIGAYLEHGGVLEDNWRLLSKLEDLVALCDMLNQSTEHTPNRIRDLRRLIERTVQGTY
ncbi:phosphotransferase family protein [Paenibacillus thermotolerans]|uniref:phosphotransferase family protein n=1 Tax=Paenibacillus thermotolerans TaxID=3027807 RepID=UPI0023678BA1|nr:MULTISPECIES: aminoglycoside phosphotransferase family protein [unclassified Paenibacillus]